MTLLSSLTKIVRELIELLVLALRVYSETQQCLPWLYLGERQVRTVYRRKCDHLGNIYDWYGVL
jgi:hypothetical protein